MDALKKFEEEFTNKIIGKIVAYVETIYSENQNRKKWEQSIDKACRITEGVSEEYGKFFRKYTAVNRYYIKLCSEKYDDEIYKDFIVATAVETNNRSDKIIAFAVAILDNWFESNNMDYQHYRNKLNVEEVKNILSDNYELYPCYYSSYNDSIGPHKIRVYYPRQGKCYLEWDKTASTIVNVNLSNGVEFGFCRVGMDYALIDHDDEVMIKCAYVNKDREILRFGSMSDLTEEQKVIWVR